MRVLMVGPDSRLSGGVVDVIDMLGRNFSRQVEMSRFTVGARQGESGRALGVFRMLMDLMSLVREYLFGRYSLVHLNPSLNAACVRDGLALWVLGFFPSCKVLVFFHGWDPSWEGAIDRSAFRRILFRAAFKKANAIVVLSSRFRDRLIEWGFDASKISVSSTMFDPATFVGVKRDRVDESTQILFLSRFVVSKGVDVVLEAFERLSRDIPDVRLVLAGDGPEIDRMRTWVRERRLDDLVRFAGFVRGSEKAQLLLNSDIFVFPSRHEGCPVSLLEAMAAGMAVVTSDVGGIPDIFTAGVNGWMLHSPNGESVAKCLKVLTVDLTARMDCGNRNRLAAYERFSAEAVAHRIEERYLSIAADAT